MYKKYKIITLLLSISLVVVLGFAIAVLWHDLNEAPDVIGQGESEAQKENNEQNAVNLPALELLSSTEKGKWVIVETTYGTFQYPSAFSDIIGVKAYSESSAARLEFTTEVDETVVTIFTLYYNEEIGVPCGKFSYSQDADDIEVSVVFADPPASLSTDGLTTFYATQETFNDVIFSMNEDDRFTAVQ